MINKFNYTLESISDVTDRYYMNEFEQRTQSAINLGKYFNKNHKSYTYIDAERKIDRSASDYKTHVRNINNYIRTKYIPQRKRLINAVNVNSRRILERANISINKIIGKYNYNIYKNLNYTDNRLELNELTPRMDSSFYINNILDANVVAQVNYYQITIIRVGNLINNVTPYTSDPNNENMFNSIEMDIRKIYPTQFNIMHDHKSVIIIPNMDNDKNYNIIKKELENIEYNYYQKYRYE